MYSIGLDIGTTSIAAAVFDPSQTAVLETVSIANDSRLPRSDPDASCQDPERIWLLVRDLLKGLLERYQPVSVIGLAGQMHGYIYLDRQGRALGPLYTWQDKRAGQLFRDGFSYSDWLKQQTGYNLAPGYACATHFFQQQQGLVPSDAAALTTIHGYIAMRLTGSSKPYLHASDAAAFGLYLAEEGRFDQQTMIQIGIDPDLFPQTAPDYCLQGETRDGILVAVAIGDNQASFIGSVPDPEKGLLVNMGTGGQISLVSKGTVSSTGIESRPFFDGRFLLVGATLCGGKAYALLEQLFRSCLELAGTTSSLPLYEQMNRLAEEALELEHYPRVRTTFAGSRQNPQEKGRIEELDPHNLDARHLLAGFMHGMVDEIEELYQQILPLCGWQPQYMVGAGNALRRNPALCRLFSRRFGMPVQLPAHLEEAACGAALYAWTAIQEKPAVLFNMRLIHPPASSIM